MACLVSGFGKGAKIRTVCTAPKLRSAASEPWSERTIRRTGDRRPSRSRRLLAVGRGLGDDDRAAGRRHADYEYGLHLNQLDLVTAFAGDRPDGRLATVPSPGATHLSIWTSSKRSPLPCRSHEEEQLWLQHGPPRQHRPAVDFGQRLAGGDDKHSQPNAKLRKGRQVCMRCARPSTRRRAGPWAPETGAAQQEQPPRHGSSYCRRGATNTVRSDPHLLSISSS